jgi:hypothetical protein
MAADTIPPVTALLKKTIGEMNANRPPTEITSQINRLVVPFVNNHTMRNVRVSDHFPSMVIKAAAADKKNPMRSVPVDQFWCTGVTRNPRTEMLNQIAFMCLVTNS